MAISHNATPTVEKEPAFQRAAIDLMDAFARRTGLSPAGRKRRYLWTDAYAVTNFLELYRRTGQQHFAILVRDLISQVHGTLGRHRPDDIRTGWLSGLPDDLAAAHPTAGGLRIGKSLPERGATEPFDERLEWERDGQYFHYLTKWMDALHRAGAMLCENDYWRWAVELGEACFPYFLQSTARGEPVGLAWKMSIDLSRPQVAGISPHDALDGYATFKALETGAMQDRLLGEESVILSSLVQDHDWVTPDPLGLGGLLFDAVRLANLADRSDSDDRLIERVFQGVTVGLSGFLREAVLAQPATRRLAFRELGLAIGLQDLNAVSSDAQSPSLSDRARRLANGLQGAAGLGAEIVQFWAEPSHQQDDPWQDHRDINEVMLATALLKAQAWVALHH